MGYCCLNDIEEHEIKNNRYSLYPNPAKQELTVQTTVHPIKEITISSFEGKKIRTFYYDSSGLNEVNVPVYFLTPGIYFLEITNNKNQKEYEKILRH